MFANSNPSFDAAMAALAPYEARPHLAVAVSGGSDSMALAILADDWAKARGGQVTAITVDHGLRPGSALEAVQVKKWMRARDIKHDILRWTGPKPVTGCQRLARDARYALIDSWCQRRHILHVLLGHTADDQAETHLMRLQRHSRLDGLASMSAVRELHHCRVLRPLLGVSREALRTMLRANGQSWIDDPSNADPRFERTQLRRLIAGGSFSASTMVADAKVYGQKRSIADRAADKFLACHARLHPAGFLHLDRSPLVNCDWETATRAVGRAIATIGGRWHLPSFQSLGRVLDSLQNASPTSKTLGGCRVIIAAEEVMICRERRNLPHEIVLENDMSFVWDHRIAVSVGSVPDGQWQLKPGGTQPWSDEARQGDVYQCWHKLPASVRDSMPVVSGPLGVFSAPLLAFNCTGSEKFADCDISRVQMVFCPRRPLSIARFSVAN
tara:strand:- start:346 stop:1671 length:1326 start_codon:yes stop_codon:yes gene_type:complete